MTVTLDSLVYQPGKTADITTAQMVEIVFNHTKAPAYSRDQVIEIAIAWARFSDEFGFPRSQTWGQGPGHETGWFWSRVEINQVHPSQNNWGGLGADNSGAAGGSFGPKAGLTGFEHGALAFMCHYALYVFGEPHHWPGTLQKYAPYAYRLGSVQWAHNNLKKPDGSLLRHLGVVKRIRDFVNGRWAQTDSLPLGTLDNGYARGIVAKANEVRAMPFTPPEEEPMSDLPIRVSHIPPGNANRPGLVMVPEWITVHETSNYSKGANAEMHRQFVNNGGGAGNVSWQYTVDDREIVEHLPTTESGWHAGDGYNGTGNRKSIGIELCVNSDGDFSKTRALASRLVARLMTTRGIPIERVVQHNHWSGKNCPLMIRRDGLWPGFIADVQRHLAPDLPHPTARFFPETGQYIAQGFRDHWEQFGSDRVSIETFGYPLTGEKSFVTPTGLQGSEQYFERAVFEWHPDRGRVLLRRLGAEALEDAA